MRFDAKEFGGRIRDLRAALILLSTQLWQGAGCKRPECRIRDFTLMQEGPS